MDPKLTSVYIQVGQTRYRIGYGELEALKGGTFTVDDKEAARLEAALAPVPEPEAEANEPEAEA